MAAMRPQQFSSQNQMVRVEIESMGTERGHRTLVITAQGWQGRHHPAGTAHRPGD